MSISFFKIKSHQNQYLHEHIKNLYYASEILLDIFAPKNRVEYYKRIIKLLAFFHDLGKISEEFQEALKIGKKPNISHSLISLIIFRIFWLAYLRNSKARYFFNDEQVLLVYRHVSYIIKKHHSSLNEDLFSVDLVNLSHIEEIYSILKKDKLLKETILESKEFFEFMKNFLNLEENVILEFRKYFEDFLSDFNKLKNIIKTTKDEIIIARSLENFIDFIFIFSIFTISDRISSKKEKIEDIEKTIEELKTIYNDSHLYINLLEKLNKKLKEIEKDIENDIGKLRKEAREVILENFEKNKNKRIFKISLPTGIGKTFIAMKIALDISKENYIPVIYSLPFINLIDQTFERLKSIFGEDNVTEYHHLIRLIKISEIGNIENFEEDIDEEINFSISPIIITTFVQVFNSIFTNSRNMLLKVPLILNSVLIIDEIQNLGPEFYPLLEEFIISAIKMGFKLRVIIMSATLPPIFSKIKKENEKEYIIDLTEKYREYIFKKLNRYKIVLHNVLNHKKMYLEEYIEHLKTFIENDNNAKRIGIICNRVDEAQKIFLRLSSYFGCVNIANFNLKEIEKRNIENLNIFINSLFRNDKISYDLVENLKKFSKTFLKKIKKILIKCDIAFSYNDSGLAIMYIASNLINRIKRERALLLIDEKNKKIEDKFNELLKKLSSEIKIKKIVVITTQVIEAGVDVSFDVIFRDFAPLESIIQSAGRLNRNWEDKNPKSIYIFEILVDEDKPSFKGVYSRYLIEKTYELFKKMQKSEIEEKEIFELTIEYLELIYKIITEIEDAKKFIDYVKSLKFTNFYELNIIEKEILKTEFIIDIYNENKRKLEIFSIEACIRKILKNIMNENYNAFREFCKKFYRYVYTYIENIKTTYFLNYDKLEYLIKHSKLLEIKTDLKKEEEFDKESFLKNMLKNLKEISEITIYLDINVGYDNSFGVYLADRPTII